MSLASLRREFDAVREAAGVSRRTVPADPVEFAVAAGLEPDDWQCDVLRSTAPRLLLNCSRQSGKSTVAGVLATHRAITRPGSLVLIIGPSERQAKETFSKAAEAYRAFGYPVAADSYRKLGVELRNGSRIEALPGTEKTVRGFSGVDLLIVDEAARVDDTLYHAVRPMLAVSGGRLLMLSTPYGKRGVFYEEWTGGAEWERFEIRADQCPRITPAFLEGERRSLPPYVYEQEYECVFGETDDEIFTSAMVAAAVTDEVTPLELDVPW